MREVQRPAPVPEAAPDHSASMQYGQWCSRHDKEKDDFEERFPDETGVLFGGSCVVPVCYGGAEGTDARPNAPRLPTIGSPASTESFSEV